MGAVVKDLGAVTAYGYAKEKGYTGTEEEYAELMASYASVAESAALSAAAAAESASDADDAKSDAVAAQTAAETAQGKAENAQAAAESAEESAELWATGGSSGTPTATNNAKYYSEAAAGSAVGADSAKSGAEAAEDNAELWATGGNAGTPSATNNALYYAGQSASSATAAAASAGAADDSAEDSEAYAVGKRGGEDVPSGDPAYHNNAKYYAEDAAASAAASAAGTDLAAAFSSTTNYAAGDYVLYSGTLYRFTAAHAAGAWTGTDATEVTVCGELVGVKSALEKCAIGFIPITTIIKDSYPNRNTGAIESYPNWDRSDYIELPSTATELYIPLSTTPSSDNVFYDSAKNYVSSFALLSANNTIQIPSDAKYMIVSASATVFDSLTIKSNMIRYYDDEIATFDYLKDVVQDKTYIGYFVLGNIPNGTADNNRMTFKNESILSSGYTINSKSPFQFALYSNGLVTGGWVSTYTITQNGTYSLVIKKTDNSSLADIYQTISLLDVISVQDLTPFGCEEKYLLSDNVSYSHFKYLKYCAVGDSITDGWYYNGSTMVQTSETYSKIISEKIGVEFYIKNAVASTSISTASDYEDHTNAFVNRINAIPSDSDLITILGGTNDYGHNTPLGTIADTTDISFYGALDVLLTGIINRCPSARVIFITPLHRYNDTDANNTGKTLSDYVTAIKEKCAVYGVQVIDGFAESGLNSLDSIMNAYMPDGLHPNPNGHKILARNFIHNF